MAAVPSTHLINEDELKEMQKQKEEFEGRKLALDERHQYLMMLINEYLNVKPDLCEDLLCEYGQLEPVDEFFKQNGSDKLFVYKYKNASFHKMIKKEGIKYHKKYEDDVVFFHKGLACYKEEGVIFFKYNPSVGITEKNISTELYVVPFTDKKSMLGSIVSYINVLFIPLLSTQENDLGDLDSESRKLFCNVVQDFNQSMDTANACCDERVILDIDSHTVLITGMDAITASANDPDGLIKAEEAASRWLKQIQKEITAIELLRLETGVIGPHEEFKFWRKQMTRFNSLVNQLKQKPVINTLAILKIAKSPVLEKWVQLDQLVTRAFIEGKENTKFLSIIEKYCVPLYHRDINQMIVVMPKLLQALSMIYVYSTYYRTFTNMTQLFVKITSQMIQTCRAYITEKNRISIWEYDIDTIIERMETCINLNNVYQSCYHKVRKEMRSENPTRYFDFSEVQIFGNFNLFEKRLKKLIEILTSMKNYSILKDIVLEGKEPIINRYERITTQIVSKKYDFLNHRNLLFDKDHEEFQNQTEDLHNLLLNVISQYFHRSKGVMAGLRMQKKIEKITIPELDHFSRYVELFKLHEKEILAIQDHFIDNQEYPPLDRDMPYFAGRIAWARNLYLHLEENMNMFVITCPDVFKISDGQKIINLYNKTTETIVYYEITVYHTWKKLILSKMNGMKASVFIITKEEPYGECVPNIDPEVIGLLREISCLDRLGCALTSLPREIYAKNEFIKKRLEKIQFFCVEHKRIMAKVPVEYEKLLLPLTTNLYREIGKGVTTYDWCSLGVENYLERVLKMLYEFDLLLTRAFDIRDYRINNILTSISETELFPKPYNNEPWEIAKFIDKTMEKCVKGSQSMHYLSLSIYEASNDYIDILLEEFDKFIYENNMEELIIKKNEEQKTKPAKNINRPDTALTTTEKHVIRISNASNDLLRIMDQKTVDSVVKSVRNALDDMWNYLACKDATYAIKDITFGHIVKAEKVKPNPLIKCYVRILGNKLGIKPSLDEIQNSIKKAILIIQSSMKGVTKWSKRGRRKQFRKKVAVGESSEELDLRQGHEDEIVLNAIFSYNLGDDKGDKKGTKDGSAAASTSSQTDGNGSMESQLEKTKSKTIKQEDSAIQLDIEEQAENCYQDVKHDREVYRLQSFLQSWMNNLRKILFLPNGELKEIKHFVEVLNGYSNLWTSNPNEEIVEFMKNEPSMYEFQSKFKELDTMQENLENEAPHYIVGPLLIDTSDFKLAAMANLKQFKQVYVTGCTEKFVSQIEQIQVQLDELDRNLSKNITNLDDIAFLMEILANIRLIDIKMDYDIMTAEYASQTMSKFDIPFPKSTGDLVESVRCNYNKMKENEFHTMDHILAVQGSYKDGLMNNVAQLKIDVDEFISDYRERGPMRPGLLPVEALDKQILFKNRFDNLNRKMESYAKGELLFGLSVSEYPQFLQIGKELDLLQRLYGLYNEVNKTVGGYYDIIWSKVDMDKIGTDLAEFQNKCKRLPKALKDWPAYTDLQKTIDDFNEKVPLLEMMTNKAMKARHWQRLTDLTNYNFEVDSDQFTLKNMLDAPLLNVKDDVEDICVSAVREKDIEAKLNSVISDWANQDLKLAPFKTRGELLLKGDRVSEVVGMLEDSLMILSSLMNNRYNAPFKKPITEWVQKLTTSSEVLENWMKVQNLWVYLEAVFVGGDIAKQLPQEAKRFQSIDKSYIKIMERTRDTPNVVTCCSSDHSLVELLPRLFEQLEICQKSLAGYLEKKRLVFPRFFFVSDPVLLEILGQASDPHSIQPHLLSIFDNIKRVKFDEKMYDLILSAFSSENEELKMFKPVKCEGHVETWLGRLLKVAQFSLHTVIQNASFLIQDEELDLVEFLETHPAQVGLLGIQFVWTQNATDALREARNDHKIMQKTNKSFLALLNLLIGETTRDLTKYARTKYETLITIHVHQRDIFDDLVKQGVKSPNDFEWTKQTRFYFMEDVDKCVISITDVDFEYQNEFLGCTERLVITPLTDRCYITIAQALSMSLGAAPAGPAGTGKTETTKDMGRCLGKYVVVFNCSDQMDFRGLGRIYKGLAQSGSWGCFDEFNRIELPVLSVAAQQIAIVLQCKKEGKTQFIFSDGDLVEMNPEFGIFLTMNPGYAGRQELPENLKINFRSVAMMVPDRQIIIRVKLAACGFIENIILSRKFFVLYKLCEEQLTKQVHYDFGLRNILSVLRTLGAARRIAPNDSEDKTVMRVLRDMNLSKLIDQDEPLFLSLINDLFPGITLDKAGYPDLMRAINTQVENMGMIVHPPWVLKVVQLFETQRVRHGMMTLGPAGAGKTVCINVLMKALTDIGDPHREMRMNPKAITASEMFGKLDVATNDWTDGIFSTLWRRTLKLKKGEHCWLVLDGPVDAIWIENLNSVLDDNKTLTLANGDRIPMGPTCKIIFEVHNIDNASPATVSRNGMVFMSSSILNWSPILQGWLLTRPLGERDKLYGLFEKAFPFIYKYISNNLTMKMVVLEAFIIRQACDLLQGIIPVEGVGDKHLERLFIFALMWSLGAFLELNEREKMESFIRENSDLATLDLPPSDKDATIFEFRVNTDGNWEHWNHYVEEYVYPKDHTPEYAKILVPNVDNVRTEFLIETISKQEKSVLLIGEQGTAKTVMISKYMGKFNPERHVFKSFNFSSATTPALFQRTLESFVEKRVGTTFGPPAGKKMTVFVDDINMPLINEWGDQIANEIVRQTMEMKGFYSLEKPGEFINIVDVQFVAAMIHPGGGRNDIPERLKRHFNIFNCTLPSNNSIDKIFSVIGLGHYCKERGFSVDVIALAHKLIPLTRSLWQHTKSKMLPTPAKFHYVFNLRDLSRIWQGIINTQSDVITTPPILLALWKHECMRVISDRFISPDDELWFVKTLQRMISEDVDAELAENLSQDIYFVDFLRDPPEPTGDEPEDFDFSPPKIYEPIPGFPELKDRLTLFMTQYNESIRGAGMDLVFFIDCMIHLIKISRVIRTPLGNALLVGVGGSGKQSLTRLAAFIAGYKSFQITLTRSYNVTNLLEDLKVLYKASGQDGKGTTFIFTDNEIKDEGFLEYMNNILASGVVSGLFPKDEMDEMIGNLVPIMKKEFPKRPPTNENLSEYFFSRVRKHLHVVLCFSPVGQKFRKRALYFPGLISGCIIDWFQKWPRDALLAVATHYIGNFDMVCDDLTKQNIIQTVSFIHDDVSNKCTEYFDRYRRVTHVTPKSYLSFLQSYRKVYSDKRSFISELARRMDSGLQKLVEAQESIAILSKELVEKEKELDIANKEAEKVLENVTQQTNAAQIVKDKVQRVKDKCLDIVETINKDRVIAEGKLEDAKPALLEAEEALNTIKPADISTVRKLAKPPHLIQRIMDCVLILFQRNLDPVIKDPERPCMKPSWGESLKMMAQSSFLNNLLNFPRDLINEEMVDLLYPYLSMEDYNLETAKKVCGNVAGLLQWTRAMEKFYWVNKEVLPLKDNLAKQEIKLRTANHDLEKAEGLLQEKEALLAVVKAEYDVAMKRKQELADDAEACRRRMNTAKQLIDGLSGEKIRWTEQSKMFKDQIKKLVGDILICTAFLSYTGPFNQDFRVKLMATWTIELARKNIPSSHGLDIIKMLADPPTISEWNLQGLPNDELSIQNGIIVTSAARYPLLIDPQSQGKNWIKKREASKELQLTSLNHKYFRTHLEDALSLGRPMLIEDINEELDPALDNVLEKNFIKMGTGLKVKVGDKEVDVLTGFKLYITTKLPNPHYTPEIYAKTSLIDFTVTIKGLEDQLLGRVIKTEKEELEKSRIELVENMTNNKRRMQELEDSLLERLANTQGSLVDDQDLLDVLNNTKVTSQEVSIQLSQAVETEKEINTAREEYRPVATRGSVLYFLFTEMSNVNRMYQMGLKQFLGLFDQSMIRSDKSPITQRRIAIIIEYMTLEMWRFSVRGMYKEDRMTLTLMLALKIDLQSKNIRQEEFDVFIKGGSVLDLKTVPQKPSRWITDLTWLNLNALSVLNQFSGIIDQVTQTEKQWRQWYDKEAPENETLPCGYDSSLDTFRRLLLVRSWCPDRTLPQAKKYIAKALGEKFADEVLLNMDKLVFESDSRSPLINLLSMGSDATPLIEQTAKRKQIPCKCVSMGQGQEIHARKLITKFMQEGGWVLLQNCHLCLDYVEELFLQLTDIDQINDKYRLWVTTEVHLSFSINFLQLSVKFTNEPPEGIKANLLRTYNDVTQDFLDTCVTHHWKIMLYGLAFLHCTVQERRKFGPLGWNIPYEFNQSDFNASIQFVQNHLDSIEFKKAQKISGIDWKCVRYMISEIQYGGRVTDDFDKTLLLTITRNYFQEKMFSPEFQFFTGYNIPLYHFIQEYITHISHLPSKDTPEAFGLHPNADITYSTKTTKIILDTILSIQPKDAAASGGETRESVVMRHCADMLQKLPQNYIAYQIQEKLQKLGILQPMNIFLRQEVDRMNRVIKNVRNTLTDLQLAIQGTIIMNENLRDALDCLYDAKVPKIWFKISWDSTTLGFWFSELVDRNTQFSSWLNDGRPHSFWMTGFFNPQGFLTAMRQEVTRSHDGWALDSVVLTNKVTKHTNDEIREPPKEGVYVYGLFVEGAAWDKRNSRLTEPKPKELYDTLPVINIYAIQESVKNKMDLTKFYVSPIYKKPRRTDLTYIASVELSCSKTPDHWVMRGVALLCDIK